jgi:hypothetical protein
VGKCAETTTSGDAHLAYAVRVVDSAGTHRATLATVMATSTEFPVIANAATRIHNGTSIPSFAANAGDRLVIELGIHGVTPANETMQMRVGDPTGTADFALTAALTTDLDPWCEFSQDLTFGAPATSSAAGVATTTVTRGAKRLLAAIAIGGIATCAATLSVKRAVTVSASGQATTTATLTTRPVVSFDFPANNNWKDYQGNPTIMSASGTDAQDGTLAGGAIVWTSSLDGSLGTGLTKAMTSLTTGTHTISVQATDSNGATSATVSRTVTIGAALGAQAQFITRKVDVPASAELLIDGDERYFQAFLPKTTAITAQGWTTPFRTMTCYAGSDEQGADNVVQMTAGGSIPQALGYSGTPSTFWPILTLFLQQPEGTTTGSDPSFSDWYDSRMHFTQAIAAEDAIFAEFNCDPTRKYYTGYSQGGIRGWEHIYLHPDRYAAFMSYSASLSTGLYSAARIVFSPIDTDTAATTGAPVVVDTPLRMFNSSSDGIVGPSVYNLTKNALVAEGLVAADFFRDVGGSHSDVWTVVHDELVDPGGSTVQTWLFGQQNPTTANGQATATVTLTANRGPITASAAGTSTATASGSVLSTGITLVDQSTAIFPTSGSSAVYTFISAANAGDTLTIFAMMPVASGITVSSITGQTNVTWSRADNHTTAGTYNLSIWRGIVAGGAAGTTATINFSGSIAADVCRFVGQRWSSPTPLTIDFSGLGSNGSGATRSSGTISPTAGRSALLLASERGGAGVLNSGPTDSFSALNTPSGTFQMAYRIVDPTSGTYSTTWTHAAATTWESTSAVLAEAAAVGPSTASAAGIGTASVTASRIRSATASAAGQATASADLHAIRLATASAAGTGTATVTPSAIRAASANAAGIGSASVTASAKRLASTSAAGIANTTAEIHAKRLASATAIGAGTATADLALVTADLTATASGTSTASVTAALIRSTSAQADGSSTASATPVAIRGANATASGSGTATVTASALRSGTVAAAGVSTASADLGIVSTSSTDLSDLAVLTPAIAVAEEGVTAVIAVLTPDVTITDLSPVPSITVP